MDYVAPFQPGGPMISLLGSSSNTGFATPIAMPGPFSLIAFNRAAATDAYLVYGPNSSAVAGAVLPAVGLGVPPNPTTGMLPLPARSTQTFSFSGQTFVSILIGGTGNATIDLVAGEGS